MSTVRVDTVSEYTSANGITIDGVVIKDTTIDFNGTADAVILDADADTSISSPTDDQIDIEIAGADDFTFTANSFNVLAGSQIDMNGTKLVLDANANTSITADTDDQIDIEIAGADDFTFTANSFNILAGSTVVNSGSMAPDISSTGKTFALSD